MLGCHSIDCDLIVKHSGYVNPHRGICQLKLRRINGVRKWQANKMVFVARNLVSKVEFV